MPVVSELQELAIGLSLMLVLCIGCWFGGEVHGKHKAELACVTLDAKANTDALAKWKAEADTQRKADETSRAQDADRTKAAADQAEATAARFAALKIAVVQMPPKGECTLSPAWITAFNGAH
jgi:hypothetical protein